MPLFGRSVFVTGGTQGLGRALAVELAVRRARVAITSRYPDRAARVAEEVAREVTEHHPDAGEPRVVGVACAVTDPAAVERAMSAAEEALSGLTDVVANVGKAGTFGRLDRVDPAEWRETFAVNLFGTYHTFLAGIPAVLRGGGGTLVGVSGYGAVRPAPFLSAYSCSKAALGQLVRVLAQEYADQPLRFLLFSPGILDAGLSREVRLTEEDAPHFTGRYPAALRQLLQKPVGEAARLAASLVDPANPLPSGQKVSLHTPLDVGWAMARARLRSLRPA